MFIFILWLVLTGVVAAAAEARGRSGAAWFFVAFFLSPLIGILLLLLFPNLKHERLLEAARGVYTCSGLDGTILGLDGTK